MSLMQRRRKLRMCCLRSQCSSGQIVQSDSSPTGRNLLTPEAAAQSPGGAADPPSRPDPHRGRTTTTTSATKSALRSCESCVYRVCGCQVPPPSSDLSTTERESSLDVDLMDPVVARALDIFGEEGEGGGGGGRDDDDDVINMTPKDLDERLNKIDFVSVYFRNYHRRSPAAAAAVSAAKSNERFVGGRRLDSDGENRPMLDVVGSSPIYRSMSEEDFSSSLPSSFQLDRGGAGGARRRIFAPANSPVSGFDLLSSGSERGSSAQRPVSVRLQREFSAALGFLFDDQRPGQSPGQCIGPPSSGKRRSLRRHSCNKRVKKLALGDRPPCLGQEQSPMKDSPSVALDAPIDPQFRLVALTPNDVEQNVTMTPSPNSQGHDVTAPPTVRRGLRFPLEQQQKQQRTLSVTPKKCVRRVAEGSGGSVGDRAPRSSSLVKHSAEKVRHWLNQQHSGGGSDSISTSGTSSRNSNLKPTPPFHKRRPRRRLCPPVAKYQRLRTGSDETKPPPEPEVVQRRSSPEMERTSVVADREGAVEEEAVSSSQLHSDDLSSSGFLADRSSTTKSSLRTSNSDHVTPFQGPSNCRENDVVKIFCNV